MATPPVRSPYSKPPPKPKSEPKGLQRTGFKHGPREVDPERLTRVRGSDWREHGKGRDWPVFWKPEKWFQAHVEDIAHSYGWKTSHAHLPYFDTAGIPDLTAVCVKEGRRRALFAELKVRDKKGNWKPPKGAQAEWLSDMILAGLDVRVWLWPDSDDEIHAEFAR